MYIDPTLTTDILNALEDLSAYTLYTLELKGVPHLTREVSKTLVEEARLGNDEARQALVLNCLRFILIRAHNIYRERQPAHIDFMDLIGVANLEMLQKLNVSLEKRDPVGYLMTVGIRAMQVECTYHAPMIQRPERTLKELVKYDPYPASAYVESLDEPVYQDGGQRIRIEQIEAPALDLTSDEQHEKHKRYRFTALYEAVKRLQGQRRATIIRLYGLFGQPAETPDEIAATEQIESSTVHSVAFQARRRLRVLLEDSLSEMLQHTPLPDEEE